MVSKFMSDVVLEFSEVALLTFLLVLGFVVVVFEGKTFTSICGFDKRTVKTPHKTKPIGWSIRHNSR
jgi:hypothetical protein